MSATNLRSVLAGYAPLTSLVGTRIYSDRGEQSTIRPFIAFELNQTEYLNTLEGNQEVFSETFDIACFGDTRLAADAVADQVMAAVSADKQNVVGRVNDFIPEMDVFVTNIQVVWMD
jgi:hypothetical protein